MSHSHDFTKNLWMAWLSVQEKNTFLRLTCGSRPMVFTRSSLSCSRPLDYWFRFIGSIRRMMFTPLISQLFDLSNKGSMIWIDIKYKYFWFIFLLSRMVACATCLDFFFFLVNQTKFFLSYILTCAKKVSRGLHSFVVNFTQAVQFFGHFYENRKKHLAVELFDSLISWKVVSVCFHMRGHFIHKRLTLGTLENLDPFW